MATCRFGLFLATKTTIRLKSYIHRNISACGDERSHPGLNPVIHTAKNARDYESDTFNTEQSSGGGVPLRCSSVRSRISATLRPWPFRGATRNPPSDREARHPDADAFQTHHPKKDTIQSENVKASPQSDIWHWRNNRPADRWPVTWVLASRGTDNRGRMAATSVAQPSVYQVRDTVPDGEIQVVMRLREVNAIQRTKHRTGIVPIRVCEPTRAQRVDDGNRQQRGFHAVTRNVEQIKGEPLRIHPMVTEPVATKLRGSGHGPVR